MKTLGPAWPRDGRKWEPGDESAAENRTPDTSCTERRVSSSSHPPRSQHPQAPRGAPCSPGPQVKFGMDLRGEQPRYLFISKSTSGPCELFIQPFRQQPLSPCAVLEVTQTQGSGPGERHMNNYHVICSGLRCGAGTELGRWGDGHSHNGRSQWSRGGLAGSDAVWNVHAQVGGHLTPEGLEDE